MTMLEGAPWLLAHRSMLKHNKPLKVSLYGNDYVLWQDSMGRISGLPNICPHMGAMLSEGWCTTKQDGSSTVACPFHALEFDSNGCTMLANSNKLTPSLMQPLKLIVRGDFIWSYGEHEPKVPIPTILDDVAAGYEFIGHTGDCSVDTNLLSMLLNMHDYNHPSGTHRPVFRIEEVQFEKFVDDGFHSHAYFNMVRAETALSDIFKNPSLLLLPRVLQSHLENFFPCLAMVHGETSILSIRECHFFIPESTNRTRTYVLLFGKMHNPLAHLVKRNLLRLAEIIVAQDVDILTKIYPDTPQHIKLNNEVGMDWVRRNFKSFGGGDSIVAEQKTTVDV